MRPFTGFPSALLLPSALLVASLQRLPCALGAASPACPCVDPWAGVALDAACADGDPANPRAAAGMSANGDDITCVPADYGSSVCSNWDDANAQCLQELKPEWCTNAWCYVNASDCLRP